MSNKITVEDILEQCFGKTDNFSSNMDPDVVEIMIENREKRRAEIIENIQIARLKKQYGENVKIVEDKQATKMEKIKERMRRKLEERNARKVG
jgi:maltose-binding protein MalE